MREVDGMKFSTMISNTSIRKLHNNYYMQKVQEITQIGTIGLQYQHLLYFDKKIEKWKLSISTRQEI